MERSADDRGRYEIVFRGESDALAGVFPGLATRFDGGNTVLSGPLIDRADLQGLLAQADALGFELVSVNQVDVQSDDADA